MELIIKHFSELSTDELYDIIQARVDVFVVEQKCPYRELDDKDKNAYHIWLRDENGIIAYLRTLDKGMAFEEASVGRIITVRRGQGYGALIMREGIKSRWRSTTQTSSKLWLSTTPRAFMRNSALCSVPSRLTTTASSISI